VCTLFYQVSPTLHAPATMVAVTTLAGGGGRVTVGGGAGCVRRIAEGKMLGGVCTSSAGKNTAD
jgi:hypothetical protein